MARWIHADEAKQYRRIVKETYYGDPIPADKQPYTKTEYVIRIDGPKVIMGIRIWMGYPNTGTGTHTFEGGIKVADRPLFYITDLKENPDALIYAWTAIHVHRYVDSGGGHGEAVMDIKREFWFDSPIKILVEEGDMIYINRIVAGGTDTWGDFCVEIYYGEKG